LRRFRAELPLDVRHFRADERAAEQARGRLAQVRLRHGHSRFRFCVAARHRRADHHAFALPAVSFFRGRASATFTAWPPISLPSRPVMTAWAWSASANSAKAKP